MIQEHIFDRLLSFITELNSTHEHTFDRLLSFITELNSTHEHTFNVVLFGNMNAHTSNNAEFVLDNSLSTVSVLPLYYSTDMFIQRCSQDKEILSLSTLIQNKRLYKG